MVVANLYEVRDDYLEASHDHHLRWGYPADSFRHQHTAYNSQTSLLTAENPGSRSPVTKERVGVKKENADDRNEKTTYSKPKDKDRVVNMSGLSERRPLKVLTISVVELPCNDGDPSR